MDNKIQVTIIHNQNPWRLVQKFPKCTKISNNSSPHFLKPFKLNTTPIPLYLLVLFFEGMA